MVPLDPGLRRLLEKAVLAAREAAERAADVALKTLAVDQPRAFPTHNADQRQLRNALRSKVRQLGGGNLEGGYHLLVEELAYGHWHRMLFARFLAENALLMHPTGVPVTLRDCAELAAEEGESDPWQLAARYAGHMLPGIFPIDDPIVQVRFAPEGRAALEAILAGLPSAVFTSDDGLGWVYQFWQGKKKKEVSGSGRKIEKLDLAAYSQLFTEHYMVQFLLDNSLGAWWATRHPDSPLLKEFTYLRYRDDGTPAAGAFPGWPESAAEVTVMDPCCGSGHFLVTAFDLLRRMRMEEEGLTAAHAADAVLRDNLFGLEIDPRCVQIAAFALALTAWKAGGYRQLPLPNLACSGIPVTGQLEEWTKLAGDDVNLRHTLEGLHNLFRDAPDLGSLINPFAMPVRDRMFAPDFAKVVAALEGALAKEADDDPVAAVFGEAAKGAARAAELLARQYTLVATNVPYLGRGKQGARLKDYIEGHYSEAKADLATAFLERCREFTASSGSYALVTPQNWLFLRSYRQLREKLFREQIWCFVSRLGEGGFESSAAAGAFSALGIWEHHRPEVGHEITGVDASVEPSSAGKEKLLRSGELVAINQMALLRNPDAVFSFASIDSSRLLGRYAYCYQGISTGDSSRLVAYFWEMSATGDRWKLFQVPPERTSMFAGRECVVDWGTLLSGFDSSAIRGREAWGKEGVAIGQMRGLPATLYQGTLFSNSTPVIIVNNKEHLSAIWAFCMSPEFSRELRQMNPKLSVDNGYIAKVPFDLDQWKRVAEDRYPQGLPEPHSDDPTQWLFKGSPADSTDPLQVAVARLLGYRWPQQDPDRLTTLADQDGILPLVPLAGEEPAGERLRALLAAAYGEAWSPALQDRLLQQVGFGDKGLDIWLRDGFFEQHCKLFHQRPFIWHIWDGRRDGFSALVNYHKLDAARLEKLIYTYLGDWIRTQRIARDAGTPGADARLVAALELQKKLEAIRNGEPPYDIYVRWKPIEKQSIGWAPDLNDGVRLNIRPFVEAGVLRNKVNGPRSKDRGLNPDGSERHNDLHFSVSEKLAARKAAGVPA